MWLILESGRYPRRLRAKEMCSDRPRRRLAERTRLDGPRRFRLRAAGSEARTGPWTQTAGTFAASCRLRPARSWPGPVCGGRRRARSAAVRPMAAAGPEPRTRPARWPTRSADAAVCRSRTTGRQFPSTTTPIRTTTGIPPRHGAVAHRKPPRRSMEAAARLAAAARPATCGTDPSATPVVRPTDATVESPALRTRRGLGATPAARVVCRPDQGRRPGARPPGAARPRLASRVVQGHLRAGQSRPVARRDPAGRVGEQDQVGAARALQDRRDGQGRRRQDDRVGQRRFGFRRVAPGRPRGGHRRRHRVREAGQPGRPEGAGLLLGAGVRPASRDVRRRAQPGGQQRGRPVRAGRRGDAGTPPRPGSRDLSGSHVAAGPLLHDLDHRLQLDHGHPRHPGGAAGSRRADRGVLAVGRRRGRGRSDDGLAGRPRD